MKYTREQGEQVFKDFNKWVNNPIELYKKEIEFLDYKFPLPETGWLKSQNGEIIYRTGETSGYGINYSGEWNKLECWSFRKYPDYWQPATREEVEDALINYARKQGYKNGNYKCLSTPYKTFEVDENIIHIDDNDFDVWHGYKHGNHNLVFNSHTGEWAKIIEDENKELKEQIEKVEKQLNDLKARL